MVEEKFQHFDAIKKRLIDWYLSKEKELDSLREYDFKPWLAVFRAELEKTPTAYDVDVFILGDILIYNVEVFKDKLEGIKGNKDIRSVLKSGISVLNSSISEYESLEKTYYPLGDLSEEQSKLNRLAKYVYGGVCVLDDLYFNNIKGITRKLVSEQFELTGLDEERWRHANVDELCFCVMISTVGNYLRELLAIMDSNMKDYSYVYYLLEVMDKALKEHDKIQ